MISVPFGMWLLLTAFDFGNIDQVFALIAIVGLVLNFRTFGIKKRNKVILFGMLLSPIISRLLQAPIEMFGTLGFLLPLLIFCISYAALIWSSSETEKI